MAGASGPLHRVTEEQGSAKCDFGRKLGKHLPAGCLQHPEMQLGASTQGIAPWLTVTIIYTKHLKQFQNITHSFGFQTSEASQKRFLSSSALSRSVLCRFFDLPIDQLWHKWYFHISFLSPNRSSHMLFGICASRDKPHSGSHTRIFPHFCQNSWGSLAYTEPPWKDHREIWCRQQNSPSLTCKICTEEF